MVQSSAGQEQRFAKLRQQLNQAAKFESGRGEPSDKPARGALSEKNAEPQERTEPANEGPGAEFGIPDEELTPRVRKALQTLRERAELAEREAEVAKTRLLEATRDADLDVLLPIFNRRAFVREVNRAIALAERYGTPTCLFYVDIDKFKTVNDLFGHMAGDHVLGHFAHVIAGHVRETDVLARIGGDEFGIILAHATTEQAIAKGESLMRAVVETPALWNGRPVQLSFSYGIHRLRAGETADEAIAKADQAMYAQKRERR